MSSKQLTCIYCKQHWDIANNELKPKTVICFDCKVKRRLFQKKWLLKNGKICHRREDGNQIEFKPIENIKNVLKNGQKKKEMKIRMIGLWTRIDQYGHDIYVSGNDEWCSYGTHCYHRVKRGRNAHEFQRQSLDDFCMKCEENNKAYLTALRKTAATCGNN